MTISAVDEETRNEHLIFNITKPPVMGFITHLQDQTKPIQSFWQQVWGCNLKYQGFLKLML